MLACVGAALPKRAPGGGPIPVETVPTRPGRGHERRAWLAIGLAHLASTLFLFGGAIFGGKVLYFRDLSSQYAPDFAFVADALRQGVWPLWHSANNAGEPYLLAYPVDLVLLLVGGRLAPLGVGVALHLLVALLGGSRLARRLGMGPAAAWLCGTVYGLGGYTLSTVSLLPLFQAVAWAPWVLDAWLAASRSPTGRRLVVLALVAALQASTLGAEIVLQTALVGLVLLEDRSALRGRHLARFALAGILALALAAPAVLGASALVAGTARGEGFALTEALSFSLHPVTLGEIVLPKLLGDPHAFSDADFWGRAYFPHGYPYLITLYVGLPALLLATAARGRRRLWGLAVVGLALALGRYGPLGLLPAELVLPFRGPQKLLFLTHVALALLAGFGLERSVRESRRRALLLAAPGAALLALALGLRLWPIPLQSLLAHLAPPLLDPRGLQAITHLWVPGWLVSGALALAAGLSLARGGRMAFAAAGLVAVDLLIVNGAVNPLTQASFYDLRPEVAALVRPAAVERPFRWFSYGVAHTPGLRFEPVMARARSDVWLYYLDRQALLPRAPALDGLEGAFDVDRTGWSRPGSTLPVEESSPERFREHHPRLRLANVRWVLSFRPLPKDLVIRRGEVKLPEVQAPLGLYELRDPLPRAFWVPRADETEPSADGGRVAYERLNPHTVSLTVSTPPGFIVVLDGHHPDWTAEDRSGPVPVLRGAGRHQVLPTPGGEREITLRYRPRWSRAALILAALALVALGVLARR
jgi:hypothetical protein